MQNFVPIQQISPTPDSNGRLSRICGSWLEVLPQLSTTGGPGEAVESAIHAFGLAILSRGSEGRVPIPEALAAHGSALRLLHRALCRASAVDVNELIVAIMCLRLSEVA